MNQHTFVTLVDQILAAKKQHTPLSPLDRGEESADTSALEKGSRALVSPVLYRAYKQTTGTGAFVLFCKSAKKAGANYLREKIVV